MRVLQSHCVSGEDVQKRYVAALDINLMDRTCSGFLEKLIPSSRIHTRAS